MPIDWVTPLYKSGAAAFRTLPRSMSEGLSSTAYGLVSHLSRERRMMVGRHLDRVQACGGQVPPRDQAIRRTFTSYGHYWAESFRLPTLSEAELDFDFSYQNVGPIATAMARGNGALLILPHLGGWEWAAFWTARLLGWPVTAVVEPVEPPELFEFFTEFRESLGIHPVPLGPDAGRAVLRALKDGHLVALLSDRDIDGRGIEVEFFGERTTLPAGPATLALRTGAPLFPSAIYFTDTGHRAVVREEVPAERRGPRLRDDIQRVTQALAYELEELIKVAPDQWHLQQPNWPSDHQALAAYRAQRAEVG